MGLRRDELEKGRQVIFLSVYSGGDGCVCGCVCVCVFINGMVQRWGGNAERRRKGENGGRREIDVNVMMDRGEEGGGVCVCVCVCEYVKG